MLAKTITFLTLLPLLLTAAAQPHDIYVREPGVAADNAKGALKSFGSGFKNGIARREAENKVLNGIANGAGNVAGGFIKGIKGRDLEELYARGVNALKIEKGIGQAAGIAVKALKRRAVEAEADHFDALGLYARAAEADFDDDILARDPEVFDE